MKKDKRRIGPALLEVLGESLLTSLCLGIGIFIVSLFGVNFESPNIDYDLIILPALAVFFVVFGFIYAFVQWIQKMLQKNTIKIYFLYP